ncbi:MAG TPA: hypothetical protein VMU50_14955, partial [Polyangia bacterium]|nr:hypothetical protein [Polyangia bacterium]
MTTRLGDEGAEANEIGAARPGLGGPGHRGRDYRRARDLLRFACANLFTPLGTIKSLAELSRQDGASSGPAADVDSLAQVLDRIACLAAETTRLVEDVLALERLDQDTPGPRPAPAPAFEVDVEEAISDAILLQRDALVRARCAIVVKRADAGGCLRGPWRRESLVRMFSHLFYNASWRATGLPATI